MSGAAEVFFRGARIGAGVSARIEEVAGPSLAPVLPSVYDEQVRLLIEQLYLRSGQSPRRHVGFAAADPQTDIAPMCLRVARTLSEQGKHDVGLIDICSHSSLFNFHTCDPGVRATKTSEFESRVWMVERQEWISRNSGPTIADEDLARLKDLTRQFDFSVLCCGPMSWLATTVGRACDGLVLILTANQTRRLVAQNIRDQLRAAQVPLLGTVLAQRRFPIPTALYRRL